MFYSYISPEIKWDTDAEKQIRKLGHSIRGVHKELLADVGLYWHHQIFPSHFTPGNEERYDYAERTPGYVNRTKRKQGVGQGKWVANVLTGQSFRWMMSLFGLEKNDLTSTSTSVTVRMKAPTYFTKPAVGTFTDKNGRTFTISRQPDKAQEVTQVNDSDRAAIQKYMSRRYQTVLDQMLSQAMTKAA